MNPKAQTGLMPADSASGATLHTIIAVMSFLACLALGGVLTLGRLASQWTDGLSSSVTVQLMPSAQISPEDQVKESLRLVSQWPGVFSTKALSRGEANALLEPWLGKGNVLDDLCVGAHVAQNIRNGGGLCRAYHIVRTVVETALYFV